MSKWEYASLTAKRVEDPAGGVFSRRIAIVFIGPDGITTVHNDEGKPGVAIIDPDDLCMKLESVDLVVLEALNRFGSSGWEVFQVVRTPVLIPEAIPGAATWGKLEFLMKKEVY